ncbi:MAG: hypothetical protein ACK5NT_16030 [Pyrinomonadaceae bacterium]
MTFRLIKIAFLISFGTTVVFAQDSASLRISVVDQTDAAIENASVSLITTQGILMRENRISKSHPVLIEELAEGIYLLKVSSKGFNEFSETIEIRKGENNFKIVLELSKVEEVVNIELSDAEKQLEESFNLVFTQEEIDSLPEDPADIVNELERRYGDDILIRVDGFEGSAIPPKSQIASIRVIRSGFDAEFHKLGQTVVDISSRAGDGFFVGSLLTNFSNAKLNARDPFAFENQGSSNMAVMGFFVFPSIKKRTSFSSSFFILESNRSISLLTLNATARKNNNLVAQNRSFSFDVNAIHNISPQNTLKVVYNFRSSNNGNYGIGGLSLPERAYSSSSSTSSFRVSETSIFKQIVNQTRFEFLQTSSRVLPKTSSETIDVIGEFYGGGSPYDNSANQVKYYIENISSVGFNRIYLKFGGSLNYFTFSSRNADNLNGRFVFINMEDFIANKPYRFIRKTKVTDTKDALGNISGFIQGEFRASSNLSLGLGVRYEHQTKVQDNNNFSPRFSFTWAPFSDAKFIVRGGAGIFYEWLDIATMSTISKNDQNEIEESWAATTRYPSTSRVDFPVVTGTSNRFLIDNSLVNPYSIFALIGSKIKIHSKLDAEINHTFRKSLHQFRVRNLNQPIGGILPNPNFSKVVQVESRGNAFESKLEFRLEGRIVNGLSFDASYEIGVIKSDYEDIFSFPANNYDLRDEWANSNLDQRHKFNSKLSFPQWKNFRTFAVFRFNSPMPYTITTGRDDNRDGVFNDRPVNISRNSERGSWFREVDFGIGWQRKLGTIDENNAISNYKNRLGVSITIQNVFNWVNETSFVGVQTSSLYKRPLAAYSPRTLQFGLTYNF